MQYDRTQLLTSRLHVSRLSVYREPHHTVLRYDRAFLLGFDHTENDEDWVLQCSLAIHDAAAKFRYMEYAKALKKARPDLDDSSVEEEAKLLEWKLFSLDGFCRVLQEETA
ncbi:MAG: hypothetical protein ACI32N_02715 [Bulleidia sp.]